MQPPLGVRALVQRISLAALALALLAPSAAAAPRRRASDLTVASLTLGDGSSWYAVQPLLFCANVTPAVLPAGFAPACCTVTAMECAKRCSASPDCSAFRWAFWADVPPTPADAPPGALPAGATWHTCELHRSVVLETCATQLEFHNTTTSYGPLKAIYEHPVRTGAVYYDTYLRALFPAQTAEWLPLNVSVSAGPDAEALLAANSTAQAAFAAAVVEAAQVVCCPAVAQVLAVRSAALPNATTLVQLLVQAVFDANTGSNAYLAAHIADVLASAEGQTALTAALRAGDFAGWSSITVAVSAGDATQQPVLALTAAPACGGSGHTVGVVVGLAVGLGGALLATLAAAVLQRRYERSAGRLGARPPGHDVFMAYRRADLIVTDNVHDKLIIAGLRVFYDRGGFLAGRPFATAIFAAIRAAPVVSLIVTLDMVRGWAAHTGEEVDYVLAELLLALHFARRGAVRMLFPLLVGERRAAPTGGGAERDYLKANPEFQQLCETMPAVVPTATLALLASLFAAAGDEGETLDADLAAATVRELLLGRGDDTLLGVLEMTGCALSGPEEQAGLVLRHRYAERIVAALASQCK